MRTIEEIIRRAMEEGAFDNLPGEGRPLEWNQDPFEDPDMRLAHHLLRSSGFTLPWIEERKEMETHIQGTRASLARSWRWNQMAHSHPWARQEWDRAVEAFRRQIERINRRILDYNLVVPSPAVQRRTLDVEREIKRITEETNDQLS